MDTAVSEYLLAAQQEQQADVNGGSGFFSRPRPPAQIVQELLRTSIILPEEWDAVPTELRDDWLSATDLGRVLDGLEQHKLITPYQVTRIRSGKRFGLMIGNYRVLDRIGVGGMGVVYKAEHRHLRRPVAVKVLPMYGEVDEHLLTRFYCEMRIVAQLQHPNIVGAIDAGEVRSANPDSPVLHYFVMEYVEGQDLEGYVDQHGVLSVSHACDLIYQVASALAEANKHELIHRDIKPSNILRTPNGQAKLLDFGLARRLGNRMTEPGTVLGTIDYLAPEQARDSSNVDIRADIYALGGTLFWCLTGQLPFPQLANANQDLVARLTQPAPSVRSRRPDIPAELDAVLVNLMALDPRDRPSTPRAVMRALLRFLHKPCEQQPSAEATIRETITASRSGQELANFAPRFSRVLFIDDEAPLRTMCVRALEAENIVSEEAASGAQALERLTKSPFDLVLVDMNMPGMNGLEVVRRLRAYPPSPNLKIIVCSGAVPPDELSALLLAGADDYLVKPFRLVELQMRVKAALNLKHAQDRSDLLNQHLITVNAELEKSLAGRDGDLIQTRNALVLSLAKLVEHCEAETGAHLVRVQRYVRSLAEEAATMPAFARHIDANFVQLVECCAPLHDIGKVALPAPVLLKPGKLSSEERLIMQQHTLIGADTLQAVARRHGESVVFLEVAIDICRSHHERWDGTGYPDRLAGEAIPLAARLVTLADVYDALRSRRVYKPALSHGAALQIMLEGSPGHFDPSLLRAFERCAPRWEEIYREVME